MEIMAPFFGITGSLIPVIFFITVWYWMKYNELDNSELKSSAKWRVTGYSVLLMATWFTCGIFSFPSFIFRPEQANLDYAKPIAYIAMILFLVGFLFLLIGERKAYLTRRQTSL